MSNQRWWLNGLGGAAILGGMGLFYFEQNLSPAPTSFETIGKSDVAATLSTETPTQAQFAPPTLSTPPLESSIAVLARMEEALIASDNVLLGESSENEVVIAWALNPDDVSPTIRLDDSIYESAVVKVPENHEMDLAPGALVQMPLPDGSQLQVTVHTSTRKPNGDLSWKGFVDGHGEDYPVVYTAGSGSAFATLATEMGTFSLESVNGVGWIYKNVDHQGKDYIEADHIDHASEHEHQAEQTHQPS